MTNEGDKHTPTGHMTVGKYMTGFILAIVLTVVSFGIAVAGVKPTYIAWIGLALAATLQILVHLHYFLHLDYSKEMRWNFVTIVFTAIILFFFIAGTIWVIFTLNSRMVM